jgi:hypothetical protein
MSAELSPELSPKCKEFVTAKKGEFNVVLFGACGRILIEGERTSIKEAISLSDRIPGTHVYDDEGKDRYESGTESYDSILMP